MKMILRKLKNHYHVRRLRRKDLPPVVRDYVQSFRHLDVEKPISDTDFIVFDTEMTGFKAKKGDRILSISGLRLRNDELICLMFFTRWSIQTVTFPQKQL